jgi:hypothetical protein
MRHTQPHVWPQRQPRMHARCAAHSIVALGRTAVDALACMHACMLARSQGHACGLLFPLSLYALMLFSESVRAAHALVLAVHD